MFLWYVDEIVRGAAVKPLREHGIPVILRRIRSYVRFRMELYRRFAIDVSLLVVGITGIIAGGHTLVDIVGWMVAAASAYLFGCDVREGWRRRQRTRVVENEDFNDLIRSCSLPRGFRLFSGNLAPESGHFLTDAGVQLDDSTVLPPNQSVNAIRPYISNEEINRTLDCAVSPLLIAHEVYRVPEALKVYRERSIALRKPDFNERKVRLCSDLTTHGLESGDGLTVQPTDYFSSVFTNEMACEQFEIVEASRNRRPRLVFAVADLVIEGGYLLALSDSCLSNHIGVSSLILSDDNQLVVQDQGPQCVGGNETAVGASGSVDLEDLEVANSLSLQELLRHAMEREAAEELSAKFKQSAKPTVLTGYARYLARGGKPEFFGISRSISRISEMQPAPSEKFVSGIRGYSFEPTVSGLSQTINELLGEGQARHRRYSLSMVVCLRAARNYLLHSDAPTRARLRISS